jgi:hypothetical protein
MSYPTDPTGPGTPQNLPGTCHELHRRGRAFGLEYNLDIRIMALDDAVAEPVGPLLPPLARRLALPRAAESTDTPAPDGVGRWESEGGAVI